jgi:hypothetical protein
MDGKADTDHYVRMAAGLYASMVLRGFLASGAVPLDRNGELLGGAHRVACALALGIAEIPVVRMPQKVRAPAWDEQWFIDEGMGAEDLERLRQDWEGLRRSSAHGS